jgi:hypothetical protein
MKKLVVLAVLAGVIWYGWKHYPELMQHRPSHEAVIQNSTGSGLQRVRLTVDGQTFVKEELADGAEAVFPFRVSKDASFELVWQWSNRLGENNWSGGMVPKGPMVQRHIMVIDADAGVLYRAESKGEAKTP